MSQSDNLESQSVDADDNQQFSQNNEQDNQKSVQENSGGQFTPNNDDWESDIENSNNQEEEVQNNEQNDDNEDDWEDFDEDEEDNEEEQNQQQNQKEIKKGKQDKSKKQNNKNKEKNSKSRKRSYSSTRSISSRSKSRSKDKNKERSRRDRKTSKSNRHRSRSRSRSKDRNRRRKDSSSTVKNHYCCKGCSQQSAHTKKSCVCIVPKSQRRTHIGIEGCRVCKCMGCSEEDFKDRSTGKTKPLILLQESNKVKNGCCKPCMKAFSETGKSCTCQVPNKDRMQKLPEKGCINCGCHGCHPLDTKFNNKDKNHSKSSQNNHNHSRRSVSRSPSPLKNLNNLVNSDIGQLITNQMQILPSLVGYGIPQRTYSYIIGRADTN